jgi:hypothetical protein
MPVPPGAPAIGLSIDLALDINQARSAQELISIKYTTHQPDMPFLYYAKNPKNQEDKSGDRIKYTHYNPVPP